MAGRPGFPAILTPNALNLRAIQDAIGNTRQRIEALDAAVALASGATQAASTNSVNLATLRNQLAALTVRVTALEAALAAGVSNITTYIAGETIAAGVAVVPITSGDVGVADPSDPTRMFSVLGIALDSVTTGQSVRVQRQGLYVASGVSFDVGRAVYVGFGELTQVPSYEATAVPLGVAVTTTSLVLTPDWPALRYPIDESGVGEIYSRLIPVTFGMIEQIYDVLTGLFGESPGAVYWTGEALVTTPLDTNNLVTNDSDVLVTNSGDNLVWS